jgi:GTP cyclohydrolase II
MVEDKQLRRIAEHRLEHVTLQDVRTIVYSRGRETAIVLLYGNWSAPMFIPTRIQSSCAYGEVLGAADCDCRTQLEEAYRIFDKQGRGVLIHLDQEGRGAGLAVKARAYELQDREQLDTVEAYERLGVELDQRNYTIVAAILQDLNVLRVQLLTNNPRKVDQLGAAGLQVQREPLLGETTRHNMAYLNVKREKLGHALKV